MRSKTRAGVVAAACCAAVFTAGAGAQVLNSNPDFEGFVVRIDAQSTADAQALGGDLADATVWRMFASFNSLGAGGNPYVVVGVQDMQVLTTSGTLYQDPFGGDTPPTSAQVGVAPSLAFDSFATLNALADNPSVGVDGDFAWAANGVAGGGWTNFSPGNQLGVSSFNADSGRWETLLAQLTVVGADARSPSIPWFGIGSLAFNTGIDTQGYLVMRSVIPAPNAAALLALAGAAAARRKR